MSLDNDGKVTFFFQDSSQIAGFTETLAVKGVTSFSALRLAAIAYAKARVKLLGEGSALLQIRLGNYQSKRQFELITLQETPAPWTNPAPPSAGATNTESAQDCIQLDMIGDGGTHKKMFLAGAPDLIFDQQSPNGIDVTKVPGWKPAFDFWVSLLKAGSVVTGHADWAFAAKAVPAPGDYRTIQAKDRDPVTGDVRVYLAGDFTGTMGAGVQLQIISNRRSAAVFRGINGIKISNGITYDAVTGLSALTLRSTADADIDHWLPGQFGKVRVLAYTSQQITAVTIQKAITRKRGGVFLLRRGRSRTRRLLAS